MGAGNAAEITLPAGGCHVFQVFPSASGNRSLGGMEEFLRRRMTEHLSLGSGEHRAVPFRA